MDLKKIVDYEKSLDNILKQIEQARVLMHNMYIKTGDFQHPIVLQISQDIDQMVNEYNYYARLLASYRY